MRIQLKPYKHFLWYLTTSIATLLSSSSMAHDMSKSDHIKVATFNVSMEALNYIPYVKGQPRHAKGNELAHALKTNNQQIKNIAEIIQRTNPDIILLNEFDRDNESHQSLKTFITQYLAKGQNGQNAVNYPYFYQGPVNTGVVTDFDGTAFTGSDKWAFTLFGGGAQGNTRQMMVQGLEVGESLTYSWTHTSGANVIAPKKPESFTIRIVGRWMGFHVRLFQIHNCEMGVYLCRFELFVPQ